MLHIIDWGNFSQNSIIKANPWSPISPQDGFDPEVVWHHISVKNNLLATIVYFRYQHVSYYVRVYVLVVEGLIHYVILNFPSFKACAFVYQYSLLAGSSSIDSS